MLNTYLLFVTTAAGSGLSDREPLDFSLEARVLDLEAVSARVSLESAALLATGHGTPTTVGYAVAHPERITRLTLCSPWASGEDLYRESPRMKFVASLESVTEEQWDIVSTTIAGRMRGTGDPRVEEAASLYGRPWSPNPSWRFVTQIEPSM